MMYEVGDLLKFSPFEFKYDTYLSLVILYVTSDIRPHPSKHLSPVIPLIIVKTLGYSKNFLYFCTKSLRYE